MSHCVTYLQREGLQGPHSGFLSLKFELGARPRQEVPRRGYDNGPFMGEPWWLVFCYKSAQNVNKKIGREFDPSTDREFDPNIDQALWIIHSV